MYKSIREDVESYIEDRYNVKAENLWKKYPNYTVFRHEDNRKWFTIIMDIDPDKIGFSGDERVDIIDVKISDSMLHDILLKQDGFYPAYHMNKEKWITIILDGSVEIDEVCKMIDESFICTSNRKNNKK